MTNEARSRLDGPPQEMTHLVGQRLLRVIGVGRSVGREAVVVAVHLDVGVHDLAGMGVVGQGGQADDMKGIGPLTVLVPQDYVLSHALAQADEVELGGSLIFEANKAVFQV
jgi:hypothetical protein